MDACIEMNAVIESVRIGMERDIFLTGYVYLNRQDGFHQGFGGFVIGGAPDCKAGHHDDQKNLAAMWLVGVMRAAEVDDYTKATGKAIRIRLSGKDWGAKIVAIGHIIKDDRWFSPEESFKSADGEAA